MRVYVYYNLHKHKWSIKCMEGRMYGRVIGHADQLMLTNAKFRVSEAGRQRVLKEKKKNVHAGILGYLTNPPWPDSLTTEVTYNPYKFTSFVYKNDVEKKVVEAPAVWMSHRRVYI